MITQTSNLFAILFMLIGFLSVYLTEADVIMMNGNGAPSIIEDDEFGPDVILMPGMSNMIINDDLVL